MKEDEAYSDSISLVHLPLPLFAGTMGLAGLALVWQRVDELWGVGAILADSITGLAVLAFITMFLAYAVKLIVYRQKAVPEMTNPIRLNFLPAISISLILFGIIAPAGYWSEVLWGAGAILHLILMLGIVTSWLLRQLELDMLNPAWFIPATGNLLVPIPAAHAGYTEVAWFFFSVGISFWLIILVLCYSRLIFGSNLPDFVRPTLAILLAPPAVAYLAWVSLNGSTEPDVIGRMLYYKALFTFFILLVQLPRLVSIPFFPSWWAYTFPLAAFSLASCHFVKIAIPSAEPFLVALVGLTTLVILLVFALTMVNVVSGRLLRSEEDLRGG